jgi:membrane fusion protein, hemolysin D
MLDKTRPNATQEQRRKKPAIALQFQSPAMAVEDEEPPKFARMTLYALTGCLVAGVLWASLASTHEFVVAHGELVTTVPKLVIQSLDRESIKSIDVRPGDIVHKGQVLAALDPTFAQADVAQLQEKWRSYAARAARLEAESTQSEYKVPAAPNAAQLLEEQLFQQRKQTYSATVQSYNEQISRLNASIATIRSEIEKAHERTALLEKVVEMRQTLVQKALVSDLQLYEAQAQAAAAQHDMIQDEGKLVELGHEVESTTAKRNAYEDDWKEKAEDELADVRRKREAAAEDLKKAVRRRQEVVLVAPQDAIVLEVAPRSIGSVLREAETLFTLVPLNAPLQAEVHVSPRDIGRVHVGNEVRVKFDSFPFQAHGTAAGTVKTISADTFMPSGNNNQGNEQTNAQPAQPYYKVEVKLTDTKLRNMPSKSRLLPGMTITGEINVGKRLVISYLLYPILKGLDESMREP